MPISNNHLSSPPFYRGWKPRHLFCQPLENIFQTLEISLNGGFWYKQDMKILVLFPGKIKPKALAAAQDEYIKRLLRSSVEVAEYKVERINERSPELTKRTEAERIEKLLKDGDYLITCDERGKKIQTLEMVGLIKAALRGEFPMAGKGRMVVVVGGALGLAEGIRQKADAVWSLSSLVMAGGIARLVLLEGLYRAMSIVDGHPYHNE